MVSRPAAMSFDMHNTSGVPGSSASSDSQGSSSPRLPSSAATSVSSDENLLDPTQDPSVITGLAFRVPGARTLSQLWDNVVTQKDLQQTMPSDRFNVDAFHHPQGVNKGTTNARYGYFLDEPLDKFDNEFFRISRQEAESMDPQQRLLLEVVYEALEDAGIPLSTLKGSSTAVMVGSFTNDYNAMTTKDLATYPKYTITGTGNSILANRISYFYDLHGPSMTVDTACSSSLICFHLGSQSLRTGESDIAIVAGSSLHFDPNIYVTMTDFGMLSTDGRCRSFDRDGSGYVRGEGVCAMVLKRKSTAEAAGDRIRAVVRATGANHDGSKSGLTLPNGAAQAQLIRRVYEEAGLDLADTDYFEAHGTGTKAGDPIEANAIGSVFGPKRDRPLYLGSIKSNLGHLEGASGLAGITKAILSVSEGKILPNMHFNNPNPDIDFDKLRLQVPTKLIDWPVTSSGVRRASINSFGYGGSNAHVIIENYVSPELAPSDPLPSHGPNRPYLIPLTAHNDGAIKNNIASLRRFIDENNHISPEDLARSYSARRSKLQMRSFITGSSRDALLTSLDGLDTKWTSPLGKDKPRLGFVFTGQGAQWYAMGRQLIEQSPLFRQTIERCDAILSELPDRPSWTVLEELLRTKETSRLGESLLSQPLCAALQLAIVDLLRQWGIVPSAVVGHSSGEIAAAYAAGILSFRNAIICAYYRGLYMSEGNNLPQKGAMLAIGMTASEGKTMLEPYRGRIALAAVNSPTSLTLSGDEDAVVELKETLDAQGVFNRRLRVEQAFHSHHMVPLAPGFEDALSKTAGFTAGTTVPGVKMVSSVTAREASCRVMDAAYWAANMTGVVRFADALTGILLDDNDEQSVDILLEIGAHPALKGPSLDVVKSAGLELPYVGSLTRDKPAFESLLACAGQLDSLGYQVDLVSANSQHWLEGDVVEKHTPGVTLHDLPAYAWDHSSSHWSETRVIRQHRLRRSGRHTLLGAVVPGSVESHPIWRNYIKLSEIPWLSEHVIQGKVLFPGAGYITMALEAVARVTGQLTGLQLRNVSFKSALVLDNDASQEILLELQPSASTKGTSSSSWYTFAISTCDDRENLFEHCRGQVRAETESETLSNTSHWTSTALTEKRLRADRRKQANLHYKQLRSVGLDYGERFRLIDQPIESGPGFSLADLSFDPTKVVTCDADECVIHPTTLDSAFHAIFTAIETRTGKPLAESFVPTFIRSARFSSSLLQRKGTSESQRLVVECSTDMPGTRVAHNTLRIFDSGAVVAEEQQHEVLVQMSGLEVTALGNESASAEDRRNLFFNISWAPLFSELKGHAVSDLDGGNSLSEAVRLFCHQVPDSSILHLSSSIESALEVLSKIVDPDGRDRKFGRLNIWSESNTETAQRVYQDLEPAFTTLLEHKEPEVGKYDLVIIDETHQGSVEHLLKPEAVVIATGEMTVTGSLQRLFSVPGYSVWKAPETLPSTTEKDLTILVSKNVSTETQAVVSEVVSSYPAPVHVYAIGSRDTPILTSHVVSLVSLDEDVLFDTETEAEHLASIQNLVEGPADNVVWLTRNAAMDTKRPEQAVVNGLFRTVRSEYDGTRLATLDLDDITFSDTSYVALLTVRVLLEITTEDELAVRNKVLHIPRAAIDEARNDKLPFVGNRQVRQAPFRQADRPLALKIGKAGLLNTLAFDDDDNYTSSSALADDDIEIQVYASSLSHRDVAIATGTIDESHLGDEAAGIVVRTGKNVSSDDFKPGDRVIALRPGQGAHASLLRNPASLCHKVNDDMSFSQAASLPLSLTTAFYALYTVGRLQQGEHCLVHAASDVAHVVVQLAQRVGAVVLATVNFPEERAHVRDNLGVPEERILSSDSLVEDVLSLTDGRGVDLALLHSPYPIESKGQSYLAPLGHLIEVNRRDGQERLETPSRNVSYTSIDMAALYRVNPALLAQQLQEAFSLVKKGQVQPPPIQTFSYGEAEKAFRLLQKGANSVNKIVLEPRDDELVPVTPASFRDDDIFSPDKSYLLVGGLGGIGRSLAEWMLGRGARRLAFLSRSGANTDEARDTIAWLQARGAEALVFKANVDRLDEVRRVIETLGEKSLGGIFQAAMVLRDGPFGQLTAADWKACVHPKTLGTRNLHVATEERNLDLDFFVCFSSMSSVVGTAGQSNYSAANAYIDALMAHRRSRGQAGTTMNVAVVGDVGAVAEDASLATILDRMGYDFISQQELFYQVEEAVLTSKQLDERPEHLGRHQIISGINTKRKDVYWGSKPLFRNLYGNLDLQSAGGGAAKGTESLSALLAAAATPEERVDILTTAFIEKVSAVMGIPADSIQKMQPLTAYGLDSIVAVEFRKWFSTAISADVPLFDILGSRSIKALTTKAAESLAQNNAQEGETDPTSVNSTASRPKGGKRGFEIQPRANNQVGTPLSSYQRRLWFLHNISADQSSLNFVASFILQGHPRLDILQKTLDELAMRNEILRTMYSEGDEFTEQVPADKFQSQIEAHDITSAPDTEAALDDVITALRSHPIDLEMGECMRVALVTMPGDTHALVLSCHHINLDNGSTKTILEQFSQLYNAFCRNKDLSKVPSPRLSYADFSLWHNAFLETAEISSHLDWWRENLRDIPPASALLPFASVKERPLHRSSERTTLEASVPSAVLRRLKRISSAANATPFHFLIAAFRAFIHRYTEEDDLTMLIVDGSRPHTEVSDLMGFFVNLVPLRLLMASSSETDFESLLSDVSRASFDALAHNAVPFDTIIDNVNVPRSAAHFPISQITVNYQIYGKPAVVHTDDFAITDLQLRDIPTPGDLSLEATEDPAVGLALKLQYDQTLYSASEMDRFLENFTVFLTDVTRDHRQPINEVAMTGPRELTYLREHCWGLNVTEDLWQGESVVSKILSISHSQPDAIAIQTSAGEAITYRDIVHRAKQVSLQLETTGVSTGSLVAVLYKPGIDMVVALLGTVFSGAGYLPLDPDFAHDRLKHMIGGAGVSAVLVQNDYRQLAIELADGAAVVQQQETDHPEITWSEKHNSATDPFYVIYTSGSTGKPKGVVLTHANTRAMLSAHNSRHSFNPSDRILVLTSFTWDVSVAQIWGALTSGATMLLAKEDARRDPDLLASFLLRSSVTVTYTTPTQYASLLLGEERKRQLAQISGYRAAILAGEALSCRLVKDVYDLAVPGLRVYNQFGPSEATVQTTCHEAPYPETAEGYVSIGYGLPNCSHYAVDSRLRAVPASVIGELCEGGPQVGAGYISRPDATAQVYVENPFATTEYAIRGWNTIYRTGDRVRFLPDGQMEYKGRIAGDTQVKLRGYRIELGEIENEIRDFAKTVVPDQLAADVAVICRRLEGSEGGKEVDDRQLVALLVTPHDHASEQKQNIVNSVHSHLRKRLNTYMVPNGYHFTTTLPTLPSGKRNRRALQDIQLSLIYPRSGETADTTTPIQVTEVDEDNAKGQEILEAVTGYFQKVLKLKDEQQVTPTTSFFDLGGHSLLVLRLAAQIKKDLKVKIDVKDIFSNLTPLAVSQAVADKLGVAFTVTAPGKTLSTPEVDWRAEATLPDEASFYPAQSQTNESHDPEAPSILVTGADSLAGIHLLVRLLARDNSHIAVTGTESVLTIESLESVLHRHALVVDADWTSRVHLLSGSLSDSSLGLDDEAFQKLGRSLTTIYHFGSQVSLLKSYADLKRANVSATQDIIRLAALGKQTSIHYLSSWSVLHLQLWATSDRQDKEAIIKDERIPDFFTPTGADYAYFKTRWAAEMMLAEAATRGIPSTIYRSSGLDDESEGRRDNFYLNLIRDMIQGGSVPDFGDAFDADFVTAPYLVDAVLRLQEATTHETTAQVFHIRNPSAVSLKDLPTVLSNTEQERTLSFVSIDEWLAALEETGEVNGAVMKEYIKLGHRMFSLNDSKTQALIGRSSGIEGSETVLDQLPRQLLA